MNILKNSELYLNYQKFIHLDDNEKYRKIDFPELSHLSRTSPYTEEEFSEKLKTDLEFQEKWGSLKSFKNWNISSFSE